MGEPGEQEHGAGQEEDQSVVPHPGGSSEIFVKIIIGVTCGWISAVWFEVFCPSSLLDIIIVKHKRLVFKLNGGGIFLLHPKKGFIF